jgi:hypothetical protein
VGRPVVSTVPTEDGTPVPLEEEVVKEEVMP